MAKLKKTTWMTEIVKKVLADQPAKEEPSTPQQQHKAQMDASREASAKPKLSPERIAELEKLLGRELTPYEKLTGALERKTSLNVDAELPPAASEIVKFKEVVDRLVADRDAWKEKVEWDNAVNTLHTAAERELWAAEQALKVREANAKKAQANAERAKQHAPMLDKLRAIKERTAFDSRWSGDERQALVAAVAQGEAIKDGACPTEFLKRAKRMFEMSMEKRTAREAEIEAQLARIKLEDELLKSQIADEQLEIEVDDDTAPPPVVPPVTPPVTPPASVDPVEQFWAKWDAGDMTADIPSEAFPNG